jgi:hypothetical protein
MACAEQPGAQYHRQVCANYTWANGSDCWCGLGEEAEKYGAQLAELITGFIIEIQDWYSAGMKASSHILLSKNCWCLLEVGWLLSLVIQSDVFVAG